MNDTASLVAGNLIYDGLLGFSSTLKLEGALAESWSISPDGKVLTFRLRPNAKFHDGSPVIGEDAVASLKRALAPSSQVRKYYDCIEGADGPEAKLGLRALDARTVEIRLKQAFPPFLSVLAGATAKILPKAKLEKPGFFDRPIGSGAFRFKEKRTSPAKDLILERFEGYYLGAPKLSRLVLRELTEAEATKAAETGLVHDLANWPLTGENPVFKSGQKVTSPVAATWIIGLNSLAKPFTSVATRKLFRHDLDAEGFRAKFYPDAFPAYGYVPPGLSGAVAQAAAASQPAGKPPKEKIRLVIPKELSQSSEMRAFLESNLRAKGWNADVVPMDWEELMKGYVAKSHQAFLVSMNVDYPDAEFLLRNFESSNPDNFSGLKNPALDSALREARTQQDRRKREALYATALELVNDSAVTVNLFHPRANYWISKCVRGFEPNILADVYISYQSVSLTEDCGGGK
ncbi:MAG: ABC transporter substrate-binding protein [Oligoflexia bacterium]|nr:ABC transporter substrate-binding protein [Oligoflexia bacterium]